MYDGCYCSNIVFYRLSFFLVFEVIIDLNFIIVVLIDCVMNY